MERINLGWAKKNLEDAARFFLKRDPPPHDPQKLAAAADGMGIAIPAEWAEEPEEAPRVFKVWPENAEAVSMFWRLQTQWRWRPDGRRAGLDYGAVQWLFSLCGVTQPLALLEDLQAMEGAYLTELYS